MVITDVHPRFINLECSFHPWVFAYIQRPTLDTVLEMCNLVFQAEDYLVCSELCFVRGAVVFPVVIVVQHERQ